MRIWWIRLLGIELERVITKHVKFIRNKAIMRAFYRGKDKPDVVRLEEILAMSRSDCESLLKRFLPTCCETGIVKELVIEGDMEPLQRLKCSSISLDMIVGKEITEETSE